MTLAPPLPPLPPRHTTQHHHQRANDSGKGGGRIIESRTPQRTHCCFKKGLNYPASSLPPLPPACLPPFLPSAADSTCLAHLTTRCQGHFRVQAVRPGEMKHDLRELCLMP
ncbi:hypothetical protein E2C01_090336 [Portunus trituberculatus]|uniref:Uncharacterized protein n=1 Tax=Portunus trituberculatus TaxID=210409 RepID=A0A5B7JEF8_PORTR|nr:hypothetical protein [Portunus trituberculatus]